MPTKRRRRVRELIDRDVPAWVTAYVKDGVEPEQDSDAGGQYFGWLFCQERVNGLPDDADSPEGIALWPRAAERRNSSGRRRRERGDTCACS